jgi:hypothetical protein
MIEEKRREEKRRERVRRRKEKREKRKDRVFTQSQELHLAIQSLGS